MVTTSFKTNVLSDHLCPMLPSVACHFSKIYMTQLNCLKTFDGFPLCPRKQNATSLMRHKIFKSKPLLFSKITPTSFLFTLHSAQNTHLWKQFLCPKMLPHSTWSYLSFKAQFKYPPFYEASPFYILLYLPSATVSCTNKRAKN